MRIKRRLGSGLRRQSRGTDGTLDSIDTSGILYGERGYSTTDYRQTASGGGEAGNTTGFGAFALVQLNSLPTGLQTITSRSNGTAGWRLVVSAGQAVFFQNNGTNLTNTQTYPFTASDVGKVFLIGGSRLNGSSLALRINREQAGLAGIPGSYNALAGSQGVGADSGANPATALTLLSELTYTGTPSDAQLRALADATRVRGDLPDTISGATVTHYWSLQRELQGAADPSGRVTYGVRNVFSSNYYTTAAGANTGVRGSASGFYVQTRVRLDAGNTSSTRYFVGTFGGTTGYILEQAGINLGARIWNGTGTAISAPSYSLLASDAGRTVILTAVYDQPAALLRLYVNGVQVGAGTAAAGYTPNSVASERMWIGRYSGAASADGNISYFDVAGGNFIPTAAELLTQAQATADAGQLVPVPSKTDHAYVLTLDMAASGNVQTTIVDRVGTDNLTLAGATAEVAKLIATGPASPVQLTDRITGLANDALARVGSPQIVKIDPTIDGRRTYGAQGFSAANRLTSAAGLGLRGSATMWGHWYGQINALATGFELLVTTTTGGNDGFQIFLNSSGVVVLQVRNGANAANIVATSAASTVVAGDLLRPQQFQWTYDGTTLNLYFKRLLIATATGVGYTAAPGTIPMIVGGRPDGAIPSSSESFYALQGSDAHVPTLAELQAAYDATEAAGRLQTIPGKTPHQWDVTADVVASGDLTVVPATVLDRIGTDHLTRVGIDVRTDANSIRGIGPYGAADAWQTAPGGGVQGANTGFHVVVDVWWTKVPNTGETIVGTVNATATSGFFVHVQAGAVLRGAISGTGYSSGYTITGADVGRRTRVIFQKTATVMQLWINGVQAGADVAAASYVAPSSIAMVLGQFYGASNLASGYIEFCSGGNSLLTTGEIATLNADLTTVPPTIAGKTTKRYVFETDIAAAGGKLPGVSIEQISGGDDLVRLGSPLTLAQRVDHAWSYETFPVFKTLGTFSAANRWATANNKGIRGSAAGFWVGFMWKQNAATSTGRFVSNSAGGAGWTIQAVNGSNLTVAFTDSTAPRTASVGISPDSKIRCGMLVFDGVTLRCYLNRVLASSTAASGIALGTGLPNTVGSLNAGANPQPDVEYLGHCGGDNRVPTLAEFQAWEDACFAANDIVAIPLKTQHLYSANVLDGSNNLLDQIGTDHMAIFGTPSIGNPVYSYARSF